jgi:hypothetical protein
VFEACNLKLFSTAFLAHSSLEAGMGFDTSQSFTSPSREIISRPTKAFSDSFAV